METKKMISKQKQKRKNSFGFGAEFLHVYAVQYKKYLFRCDKEFNNINNNNNNHPLNNTASKFRNSSHRSFFEYANQYRLIFDLLDALIFSLFTFHTIAICCDLFFRCFRIWLCDHFGFYNEMIIISRIELVHEYFISKWMNEWKNVEVIIII